MRVMFPPVLALFLVVVLLISIWHLGRSLERVEALELGFIPSMYGDPGQKVSAQFRLPKPGDYAVGLAESLERPLFSETRRIPELIKEYQPEEALEEFFEPSVEETLEPIAGPTEALFRGFIQSENRAKALIAASERDQGRWFAEGDNFQGWIVVDIEKNAVHLERQGFRHVIKIDR